jgi:arginine:pyruvate transaminase
MRYAKITERLEGLGSDKWAVHIEGKEREARGESLIFLSIGEPDAEVPTAIMEIAERQMRAGRTRYSHGRGEPQILRALSSMYSRRAGRHVGPVPVPAWHPGGSLRGYHGHHRYRR